MRKIIYKKLHEMKNPKQKAKIVVQSIAEPKDKCIYVVKWSENHSDKCEHKHSNIFSVMYEREKTAKCIAFDLAFGIRTTKDFSIYVPTCDCKNICDNFIDEVTIVVDKHHIGHNKNIRGLYIGYMETNSKYFYTGLK